MKQSVVILMLLVVLHGVVPSYRGQHRSHGPAKAPPPTDVIKLNERPRKPGRIELPLKSFEIPDSLLVDQNGKKVRFYSDLVKGKVVVISFFFTNCTLVCPMMGRSLVKLKTRLGDRLGRDVFLLSISKDPKNDTPERLSKWGKEYGAGSGWTLVTGEQSVLEKILWDFAGERIGQDMHESLVMIGNDKTGVWTSTDGLLFPEDIVKVIDEVSRSQ